MQDSTGFLWIATWDGLSRYDGYEFKNYNHNPSDSTSIAYFISHNLLIDYQNNLWVYNISGISKYNRATDSFKQFKFKTIGGIALDLDGKFWCNTNEGLLRWNYQQNIFEKVEVEFDPVFEKMNTFYPMFIGFDNENQLWISGADNEKYLLTRCRENGKNCLKAEYIGTLDCIVGVGSLATSRHRPPPQTTSVAVIPKARLPARQIGSGGNDAVGQKVRNLSSNYSVNSLLIGP